MKYIKYKILLVIAIGIIISLFAIEKDQSKKDIVNIINNPTRFIRNSFRSEPDNYFFYSLNPNIDSNVKLNGLLPCLYKISKGYKILKTAEIYDNKQNHLKYYKVYNQNLNLQFEYKEIKGQWQLIKIINTNDVIEH